MHWEPDPRWPTSSGSDASQRAGGADSKSELCEAERGQTFGRSRHSDFGTVFPNPRSTVSPKPATDQNGHRLYTMECAPTVEHAPATESSAVMEEAWITGRPNGIDLQGTHRAVGAGHL